jgi:hypothetical protein
MKYTNALFFITLLSFTCLINTQQVFDQVKTLLVNFKADIQKEQTESNARCAREEKWMNEQINKAIAVLAHRTKDVNDVKAHIAYLKNEIHETENDIKSRTERIAANNRLLEQFKKERCENNLLFVKNLREHIESIEIMGLLRQDIVDYFNAGAVKKTAFLEKFQEFSHLLDEEHKLILSQLSLKLRNLPNTHVLHTKTDNYTTTRARTAAQQGVGHVDNNRGELKRLATPKYEEAAVYRKKLEAKVLRMIDALVLHLKNSRDNLTKSEIKAGEDFAIFQTNLFKENSYLAQKIKELNIHLVDLKTQLTNAEQQLIRREKLRQQAEDHLKQLRQMKKEKEEYCAKETSRRNRELVDVSSAQNIFQSVLDKLSLRVKLRTQSNVEGKTYNAAQAHEANVVKSQATTEHSVAQRQRERNALAYY